ncbi:MAG: glycosyltransferase [Patescibacteria group bacterium]|jgi:glycosyltransferase involved in cell wall biosynthesis
MKTFVFLIENQQLEPVKNWLVKNYGVPTVVRNLAIYLSSKDNKNEVHVSFQNKKCTLKYVHPNLDELEAPIINIARDYNVKSLFSFLDYLGYNRGTIGEILKFDFNIDSLTTISLSLKTFIGNLLAIKHSETHTCNKLFRYLKEKGIKQLSQDDIQNLVTQANLTKEFSINKLGVLNKKIYSYCIKTGLGINTPDSSISSKLINFNNDYSDFENAFRFIFGNEMLSQKPLCGNNLFAPISIIVPCYNTNETFMKTLLSINSQNISDNQMKMVEVIIVDDGSKIPIQKTLEKEIKRNPLRFNYNLIRLEKNQGLSLARNFGISQAKNSILLFLDSDVVISQNFLVEHSVRNQLIPNAVFVSFKQNVQPHDTVVNYENIQKGLPLPDISKDLRIKKIIKENTPGLYETNNRLLVEILGDSDHFKLMGYGRKFGIYDLPSMVIGHSLSCRKENVIKIGGFSREFKGWGIEDSYFGAQMIASGSFVIPILSCGVYHIDHPPRSGSEEKKITELNNNLEIYRQLLNSPL